MKKNKDISAINDILPQTQCGLCTYKGCKPYAEAIVEKNEQIDLCLPGGVETLRKIAQLRNINSAPLEEGMVKKTKPPMLAVIREAECIGCTKCIQACPVDAIIGSAKLMHSVITDACNGCELCVAPCPVDCIDMIVLSERTEAEKNALALQSRKRFEKHEARLVDDNTQEEMSRNAHITKATKSKEEKRLEIQAIMQRIKGR